ncbi:hypothetical protein E1264_27600 [Actinomadura sp. KC216]|uniref:hypothetical protein n=1 Tax=Actinomadura sp. KC216 TaxID=2530370 RepID=UPI00104CDB28|nr:hypothetical protein [Actinomadura sp. KC216]TDB83649.1 hypothetical protein E1264_27600 [Actinomadura sp. KC216]
MTSWDELSPKLAANPQQYKAGPLIVAAMAVSTAGVAFIVISLGLLFGITEIPAGFADGSDKWRLAVDLLCLYVLWSMVRHGNNWFGLSRRMGYLHWFGGGIAALAVARDVAMIVMDPEMTVVVRKDLPALAVILGFFLGAHGRPVRGLARAAAAGLPAARHPAPGAGRRLGRTCLAEEGGQLEAEG